MDLEHKWNLSLKPLLGGGIVSFSLLCFSYFFGINALFLQDTLRWILMGLALFQAVVQLIFFLHLGIESRPRWNLMIFFFMVVVIFLVIGGSLWIMHNLSYNVMITD